MMCKQLGSWIRIFSAGISGLIFSKYDSGLCSGQLRALNSQRRKGKKIQHTTSLVAASEKPWMRNLFFQTCFPVDKFSSRDHSTFKLFCVWFCVCVTIASKTWEQEDGEISWSPSLYIKMAECLVMLALCIEWYNTGRLKFACFIDFFWAM